MSFLDISKIKSIRMNMAHAAFSPSQPSWVYDDPKAFETRLKTKFRSNLGVEIHDWARVQIQLGQQYTNQREVMKDIRTMIFKNHEYENKQTGETSIDYEGLMLLRTMQYIDTSVYGTVKSYVNDCIKFNMEPEVKVAFNDDFQGTADAVSYDGKILRIHDLKTGVIPAKIDQLVLYAAYYCTEHNVNLDSTEIELRIYQNNDILVGNPTKDEIKEVLKLLSEKAKIMLKFKGGKL